MKHLLATLALLAFALPASTETYQCRDVTGCVATINMDDGSQKKVIFRKGDVVSTDAGWVVSTDDGWYRLRSKRDQNPEQGSAPDGPCSPVLDLFAPHHAQGCRFASFQGVRLPTPIPDTGCIYKWYVEVWMLCECESEPVWQFTSGIIEGWMPCDESDPPTVIPCGECGTPGLILTPYCE